MLAKRMEVKELEELQEQKTEFDIYTEKKIECQRISSIYFVLYSKTHNKKYLQKSKEIGDCGGLLTQYIDTTEIPPVKRYLAWFCKNRFCPLCNYKLSKTTFKLVLDIVNHPQAENYSYIFMTLTIRNCKKEELSKTMDKLLDSYTKLISNNRTQFSKRFLGTMKVLECTYNSRNKTYHPHLHVLIAVDKSYFKDTKKYLTKDRLIEIWQKALDVGYRPSVDIRATYNCNAKTVAEVSKYAVKSSEIVNADVLQTYDLAFYHRRLKSYTGKFRELKNLVLEEWKKNKTDFINYEQVMSDNRFIKNLYRWNMFSSQFELFESNTEIKENAVESKKAIENILDQVDFQDL